MAYSDVVTDHMWISASKTWGAIGCLPRLPKAAPIESSMEIEITSWLFWKAFVFIQTMSFEEVCSTSLGS
ncbi:hypothetical protein QG37_07411 [Candidozyma auris]|nr:hypothetical protein QG37_07411 [[Candida] auris]